MYDRLSAKIRPGLFATGALFTTTGYSYPAIKNRYVQPWGSIHDDRVGYPGAVFTTTR